MERNWVARIDNRLAHGRIFRPLSKNELGSDKTGRPNGSVIYKGKFADLPYTATVRMWEVLSMEDQSVLLASIALAAPFDNGHTLPPPAGNDESGPCCDQENVIPCISTPGATDEISLRQQLRIRAEMPQDAPARGIADLRTKDTLYIKTTPVALMRLLGWTKGGNKQRRLLRSLERLASTTITYLVDQPDFRHRFQTALLSFIYTEPTRRTGKPSLRIAINHFATQAIESTAGSYTLVALSERQGLNQTQLALHDELCRLTAHGTARRFSFKLLLKAVYPRLEEVPHRYQVRCVIDNLHDLAEQLRIVDWTIMLECDSPGGQGQPLSVLVNRPWLEDPLDKLKPKPHNPLHRWSRPTKPPG